MTTWNW